MGFGPLQQGGVQWIHWCTPVHTCRHRPSGSLVHRGSYSGRPLPVYVNGRGEVGSRGAESGERLLGSPGLEAGLWWAKGYESGVGISNTGSKTETPGPVLSRGDRSPCYS